MGTLNLAMYPEEAKVSWVQAARPTVFSASDAQQKDMCASRDGENCKLDLPSPQHP